MTESALSSAPAARRRFEPLLARRYALEVRQQMPWWQQAVVLMLAVLAGLAVSGAILVAAGVPAGELFQEFVVATLFDEQSLQAVLFQGSPMILVGLAASIAFRARYWNLGLEGQMICGAIGTTAVSVYDVGPPSLRLTLMFVVAVACGLLWALGPALLKLRLGVNEIIATLMLNYVAGNFLLHLLYGAWKDPASAFPHSPAFQGFERLPEFLGPSGCAILIALAAMLLVWWLVDASRAGLYLRFVQASPPVARAVGVPVTGVALMAVLLSGALAGIAGFLVVTGQEGRLTQAFYQGYGFSGILIAFLARNHPVAATVVALLMATLFVAGRSLQVFYQIPFAMVQLIQAIIVICVASSDFFIRHRLRRVRPS
ncbi:MAG: ABC transporter permease [Burkholderiaceae bacterium]